MEGRLSANLYGAKQLDLSLCAPNGKEQFRLRDIPFDASSGGVLWQQSITFAKCAPTSIMIARLIRVDDDANEELLGEYTFNHTRTLPGPEPGKQPAMTDASVTPLNQVIVLCLDFETEAPAWPYV